MKADALEQMNREIYRVEMEKVKALEEQRQLRMKQMGMQQKPKTELGQAAQKHAAYDRDE